MPDTNATGILTLNCCGLPFPPWAHARMRAIARQVNDLNVLIVNLQEVHTYGLLWELRRGLPLFSHVSYCPGLIGPKGGLVTFTKVPTGPGQFVPLSRYRGALVTELASGEVLINVHLSANTDGDWSSQNRFYTMHQEQLGSLLELANQPRWRKSAMVLSGDFNLARTCDLLPSFVQRGGWSDAFAGHNEPTFHKEFLPAGRQPQCVDYILTRGFETRPGKANLMFPTKVALGLGRRGYVSNHLGLFAAFNDR